MNLHSTPQNHAPMRIVHPDKSPIRVLIVSDAWRPQVNGVVRTLEWIGREAPAFGVEIGMLTPDQFRSAPMPTYGEIRLSLALPETIARRIDAFRPDAIHIATEGPLGFLARSYCRRRGRPFTTCYHTRFPEYIAARAPVPLSWTYAALRRFHNAAETTLVSTDALRDELAAFIFVALAPSLVEAAPAGLVVDVSQDGGSYRIRAEAVLSAPVRHVWAALTDCALATSFIPHLETCRILEKDPSGRWDVRENIANPPLLPRIRTIVRNVYAPPRQMTYKLVSGDMRLSEGVWTLEPFGEQAKVIYSARVEPDAPVPGFLVVGAIKGDLPDMLSKLEAASRRLAAQR